MPKKEQKTFIVRPGNNAFDSFLHVYSERDPEKEWKITFEPYKKNRTLAQNALMWMWHSIHVKHGTQGGSKESCHHDFKQRYILPIALAKNTEADWFDRYNIALQDYRIMWLFVESLTTTRLTTAELSSALTEYEHDVAMEEDVQFPHPGDIYNEAMGVKQK